MSDSTEPPNPHQSQPSLSQSTEEYLIERAAKARAASKEALENSTAALSIARELKAAFGVSTNTALRVEGTGLLGAFDRLCARVEQLALKVDQLAAEFSASRQEAEKRRSAWMWGLKIALSTIIVAATGSGIAWVVSLHH